MIKIQTSIVALALINLATFSDAKTPKAIRNQIPSTRTQHTDNEDSITEDPVADKDEELRTEELYEIRKAKLEDKFCNVADLNLVGGYYGNYQLRQILKDKLIFRSFEHKEAIALPRTDWNGDLDEGAYIISGADYIGHIGFIKYKTDKGFIEEVESWIVLDKYIIDGKPFTRKIKINCPEEDESLTPDLPFKIEIQSQKLIPSLP